jgi:hypothetical protein
MSDVRERSLANFSERRKAEVQLRRILLPKLSKKSGRPQNEGVRSPRNGAKGLIPLRYAGDFCARDTSERLFRQFLHAHIFITLGIESFGSYKPNALRMLLA